MASKMTFHEYYGELSQALLRACRKHNVSPSDFQDLRLAGLSDAEAVEAIKQYSPNGYFQVFLFNYDRRRNA